MKTKWLVAFLVVVGSPVVGLAQQDMVVSPLVYDFSDVEVGGSSTTVIGVSNVGDVTLLVTTIDLYDIGGGHFSVTSAPPLPASIDPDASIDVTIDFSPFSLGLATAAVLIGSNDPDHGAVIVSLSGTGVDEDPLPSGSIEEILAFFDASVADGSLVGNGPGNSANGRLNALRNMIEAAGDLIEGGYLEEAYDQLENAYKRCDGDSPPPDFVQGPAAAELE